MPYQHTNRRGDIYYIQAKERAGKTAYSATRKPTGAPVDRLPEGYEIYEKPESAQVFVRKIKPTKISPAERKLVETALRTLAKLDHFILEVEADSLVIYLSDAQPDAALSILRSMAPMTADQAQSMRDFTMSRATYVKMMRFMLADETARRFDAMRWCFLGSIDDWYFLEAGKSLDELVKKYVPHLGRESFFELM